MKCTYCNNQVDINDLHTDSLPIPERGDYSVAHVHCYNREDMKPEEFREWYESTLDEEVNQAWIIER